MVHVYHLSAVLIIGRPRAAAAGDASSAVTVDVAYLRPTVPYLIQLESPGSARARVAGLWGASRPSRGRRRGGLTSGLIDGTMGAFHRTVEGPHDFVTARHRHRVLRNSRSRGAQ